MMRIEEMALGVKRGERLIKKRGFNRRTRRRIQAENTKVQGVFDASTAIFKGPGTVPETGDAQMLQLLLDKLRPEDFGLSTDIEFFNTQHHITENKPTIAYTTICNCANFSMCIFFLPPTAVIPLHNHPGMTVFSKLLTGTMHVKSYDWVNPAISKEITPSNFKLAKMVVDSEFTAPCRTFTLYPSEGGNMHTFRAITPCIVLDVLGPPYSKEEDRDCTYYRAHPYSHIPDDFAGSAVGFADRRLSWLEEIEMPKELKMVGVQYLGPQIIDRGPHISNSNLK